jgi:ubiquinone biosynthesis protein COQ9
MPDKKLTDNEIIKALKDLLEVMLCEGDLQRVSTVSHAIEHINRLQEKNSNLTSDLTSLQNDLISAKAEIERLHSILLSFTDEVHTWSNKKGYDTTELSLISILGESKNIKANIKAEAYKECIDKIKNELRNIAKIEWQDNYFYLVGTAFFDNILKELVGDSDA